MLQPFLHQKKSDCSKPVRTGKNYIEYDSNGSNTINQRKFSNCFFSSNAFPIKKICIFTCSIICSIIWLEQEG